jgi:hypothetical protein
VRELIESRVTANKDHNGQNRLGQKNRQFNHDAFQRLGEKRLGEIEKVDIKAHFKP